MEKKIIAAYNIRDKAQRVRYQDFRPEKEMFKRGILLYSKKENISQLYKNTLFVWRF